MSDDAWLSDDERKMPKLRRIPKIKPVECRAELKRIPAGGCMGEIVGEDIQLRYVGKQSTDRASGSDVGRERSGAAKAPTVNIIKNSDVDVIYDIDGNILQTMEKPLLAVQASSNLKEREAQIRKRFFPNDDNSNASGHTVDVDETLRSGARLIASTLTSPKYPKSYVVIYCLDARDRKIITDTFLREIVLISSAGRLRMGESNEGKYLPKFTMDMVELQPPKQKYMELRINITRSKDTRSIVLMWPCKGAFGAFQMSQSLAHVAITTKKRIEYGLLKGSD